MSFDALLLLVRECVPVAYIGAARALEAGACHVVDLAHLVVGRVCGSAMSRVMFWMLVGCGWQFLVEIVCYEVMYCC